MKIRKSGEDYLEAILILERQSGAVRSIDLARHMGYPKPASATPQVRYARADFLLWTKTAACA